MFGGEEQQEEDERTKITKRKRLTVVPSIFVRPQYNTIDGRYNERER